MLLTATGRSRNILKGHISSLVDAEHLRRQVAGMIGLADE